MFELGEDRLCAQPWEQLPERGYSKGAGAAVWRDPKAAAESPDPLEDKPVLSTAPQGSLPQDGT